MSIQSKFQKLTISMKLQVFQELWDQIDVAPKSGPVPEWHRTELENDSSNGLHRQISVKTGIWSKIGF